MYSILYIKSKLFDNRSHVMLSYKSRRTLTGMVAGVVLLISYVLFALQRDEPGPEGPETVRSWALALLIFVAVAVVVLILVQILFHVVLAAGLAAEDDGTQPGLADRIMAASMAEDEMDRMIGLRSARIGSLVSGIGVVVALVALVLGASFVLALHLVLGAFVVGSLVSGAVSIHGYERGVGHG